MSSSGSRKRKAQASAQKSNISREQRLKLNYEFATHIIVSFQHSKAAYVQPFLKPVDPDADGAPDHHTVIERPMHISTILEELENGKYTKLSDVEESFNSMFANYTKYHTSRLDQKIPQKRWNFERAFRTAWADKKNWIKEQAVNFSDLSEEDMEDNTNEKTLHDSSEDEESDMDTSEDDGATEYEDSPKRHRRNVHRQNEIPEEFQGRKMARKKDGAKYLASIRNTASRLDANGRRSQDVTVEHENQTPSQDQTMSPSHQQSALLAKHAARKPQLRIIFQEHLRDFFQPPQIKQSQRQQSQIEQPSTQEHQTPQLPVQGLSNEHSTQHRTPEQNTSDPGLGPNSNPLETLIFEIVTKQVDATISRINTNANGECTEHLALLAQICSNESLEILHQAWKTRALKAVSRMQVNDILVRGVEREVGLALADTVMEQAEVFCDQIAGRAIAFSEFLGRGDGR